MLYKLTLRVSAFHKPTEQWHVHAAQQGVRAVSRKHALDKGLKVLMAWPGYADREGHPDWQVDGDVTINDEGGSMQPPEDTVTTPEGDQLLVKLRAKLRRGIPV